MPHSTSVIRASLTWLVAAGLAMTALAVPAAAVQGDDEASAEQVTNLQRRLETRGDWVEIELTSSRPFPVRALPPVLRVGEQEFLLSRNPDDGRLDTLIFRLPARRFAELADGAPVRVFHALSVERADDGTVAHSVAAPGEFQWDFGALDKSRLDTHDDPRSNRR